MKAKRRIEEILGLVQKLSHAEFGGCARLMDIGADHGWVSYLAMMRGFAGNVICSDISAKSLEKARALFGEKKEKITSREELKNTNENCRNSSKPCEEMSSLSQHVDFRVGDGFDVLGECEHVDICVIAGMGFAEIVKILKNAGKKAENVCVFVLQVRYDEFMAGVLGKMFGFEIIYDKATFDHGMVYRTIVCARKSKCTLQLGEKCGTLARVLEAGDLSLADNLGISFEFYGKNNLFDSSKEHLKALNVLLRQNLMITQGISAGIQKQAQNDAKKSELLNAYSEVQARNKSLEAIIRVCESGDVDSIS